MTWGRGVFHRTQPSRKSLGQEEQASWVQCHFHCLQAPWPWLIADSPGSLLKGNQDQVRLHVGARTHTTHTSMRWYMWRETQSHTLKANCAHPTSIHTTRCKTCSNSLLQEKLSHLLQAELVQTLFSDHTATMEREHAGFCFLFSPVFGSSCHCEAASLGWGGQLRAHAS